MAIDWFHEFEGVSRPLRLGMEAQGCLALVSCIDQLQPLLSDFPGDTAQQMIDFLEVALLAQERAAAATRWVLRRMGRWAGGVEAQRGESGVSSAQAMGVPATASRPMRWPSRLSRCLGARPKPGRTQRRFSGVSTSPARIYWAI
jgi:hypothetical protein